MVNRTIRLGEPVAPRYIYVDPRTNRVHLMVPLVGGTEIGTDNTCKSAVAMQTFFGKEHISQRDRKTALHELQRYREILNADITLTTVLGQPNRQKIERLEQVDRYIRALTILSAKTELQGLSHGFPDYPQSIQQMMRVRDNLFSMALSPALSDPFTHFVDPIFSVISRGARGALYEALRTALPDGASGGLSKRDRIIRDIKALLTARGCHLTEGLRVANQFDQLKTSLTQVVQYLYRLNLEHAGTTFELVNAALGVDDPVGNPGTFDDYIDGIMGHAAADFAEQIPSSHFENADNREKLSILVQFFLAEMNIYCYANRLTGSDFGRILDTNRQLSGALVAGVAAAVAHSRSVEDAIITFINQNFRTFQLHAPLDDASISRIKTKFNAHYETVKESPHFDEFLILDTTKEGKFYTHQYSICIDFAEMVVPYPDLDDDYFRSLRRAPLLSTTGPIPHENHGVATNITVDQSVIVNQLIGLLNAPGQEEVAANLMLCSVEGGQRILQIFEPAEIQRLMATPQWGRVRQIIVEKINNQPELLAALNAQYSNTGEFILEPRVLYKLYVSAIKKLGVDPTRGYETEDQVRALLQAHELISPTRLRTLSLTDTGSVRVSTDVAHYAATRAAIDRECDSVNNTFYLSPGMAASLYKEVKRLLGETSPDYIAMNVMHNQGRPPAKIQEAFRLLNLPITAIGFPGGPGTDGYVVDASAEVGQLIQNIDYAQSRMHLTPEMARILYERVTALGLRHLIDLYDNGTAPVKIQHTLNLLGLTHTNLMFNGVEGYWVNMPYHIRQYFDHICRNPAPDISVVEREEVQRRVALLTPLAVAPPVAAPLPVVAPEPAAAAPVRPALEQQLIAFKNIACEIHLPEVGQWTRITHDDPWSFGRSRHSGNIAYANNEYQIEFLANDEIVVFDKLRQYARIDDADRKNAAIASIVALCNRLAATAAAPIPVAPGAAAAPAPAPEVVIERVAAFRGRAIPATHEPHAVQLNCPEPILEAFRQLLTGTTILGSSFTNPYTGQRESFPAEAQGLTARHLQILARNERQNTTGVMDVSLYRNRLNDDQIARLRCLVKATNVAGLTFAEATGGYRSQRVALTPSRKTIIIDQPGLQWQGDFRNTGGVFFYPADMQHRRLPENYQQFQREMYLALYGVVRPEVPSVEAMRVTWLGVPGLLDLQGVSYAIASEFLQALDAVVQRGATLAADEQINFKFLKAGMGFFAEGLELAGLAQVRLEHARLKGILLALQKIQRFPAHRQGILGRIARLELPFSESIPGFAVTDLPAEFRQTLQNIGRVTVELGLIWGRTPTQDALTPFDRFVTATTNCGDPHAMAGNEGGYSSVDASIAANAYVDHLNVAFLSAAQLQMNVTGLHSFDGFVLSQPAPVLAAAAGAAAPAQETPRPRAPAPVYRQSVLAAASAPTPVPTVRAPMPVFLAPAPAPVPVPTVRAPIPVFLAPAPAPAPVTIDRDRLRAEYALSANDVHTIYQLMPMVAGIENANLRVLMQHTLSLALLGSAPAVAAVPEAAPQVRPEAVADIRVVAPIAAAPVPPASAAIAAHGLFAPVRRPAIEHELIIYKDSLIERIVLPHTPSVQLGGADNWEFRCLERGNYAFINPLYHIEFLPNNDIVVLDRTAQTPVHARLRDEVLENLQAFSIYSVALS